MPGFLLFLRTVLNGVLPPSHGAVDVGGGGAVSSPHSPKEAHLEMGLN